MARRLTAVLIVLGAIGASGAVILAQGESNDTGSLTAVSNRGTSIDLVLDVGRRPHPPIEISGDTLLLARRDDREFYRFPQADGGSCWGTGRLRDGSSRIDAMQCQHKPQFPSRAFPLMNFSPIEMSAERPHPHFMRLEGIAADGVTAVAVIDADNRLVPAAKVVENVYYAEVLPKGDFYGLAALDGDGKVLWRSTPVS